MDKFSIALRFLYLGCIVFIFYAALWMPPDPVQIVSVQQAAEEINKMHEQIHYLTHLGVMMWLVYATSDSK